jgi:hypothetical protein
MIGIDGSAGFADIDSDVAVAVMPIRLTVRDPTAAARIDRILAGSLPND